MSILSLIMAIVEVQVRNRHFQMLAISSFVLAILLTSFNVPDTTNPQTDAQSFNQGKITNSKRMRFVITEDAEAYLEFIENIRAQLTTSVSYDIPVLMPQPLNESSTTVSWLIIELVVTERTSVSIWLDQSNLYLRGYARNNETEFWEFSDSRLLPRSQSLRFSGSYCGSHGLEDRASRSRAQTPLGCFQLQHAVSFLANSANPLNKSQETARSLLVITQMVCEATRIRPISDLIGNNWLMNSVVITDRMLRLENGWGRLSTAVQLINRSNATPDTLLPNIEANSPALVFSLLDASTILGILLFHRSGGSGQSRPFTYNDHSVTNLASLYGARSLMNVEHVRVDNIDGENPGDLFGNVRVDDGWFNFTFYDRSSKDYELKGSGEFATLTGPMTASFNAAVSGEDEFTVSVNLWDYDHLSPNDEIARGDIVWDPKIENINSANYDKHLLEAVTGKYGQVTVGYSVIREALAVTIDVVLVNGDGEDPADVYGTLRASQDLGGSIGEFGGMTLFERSSNQSVPVRPQQSIPLIRKVVAASVNSPFMISADLWDYDLMSPDDAIAQGTVSFPVTPGTQKSNINGNYGQVLVSVTCE